MIGFDRPVVLLALVLLAVPLLLRPYRRSSHPALTLVPEDTLSRTVLLLLRVAGILGPAFVILALAGPFSGGGSVARQGIGANIVLLFDRSSSMDNTFADRQPNGSEESKSAVAKRLIREFVDRRPRDRIGVAAFSTAPMTVLPITDHLDAVRGAVAAIDQPGLAYTDVGRGLALAFDMIGDNTGGESRAVILISDGAAVVGREVQEALRQAVKRNPVNLYWLFIRSKGSYGLFETPAKPSDDTPQARPERHLHIFLKSLGIPYQALEAQSPQAIADAIAEIDRLERRLIVYREKRPRIEHAPLLYDLAGAVFLFLAVAALAERRLRPESRPFRAPLKLRDAD